MPKSDCLPKRYLTCNEVCRYLGICLKSLEKLMAQEEILPIRVLSEYRFDIYDMMFMTVSSYDKPVVVDENRQDVIDQSQIYSGCYARASVNFAAYNHKTGGKGIGAYLNGIQKLADGEALGFVRESADTMFGDEAVDDLG